MAMQTSMHSISKNFDGPARQTHLESAGVIMKIRQITAMIGSACLLFLGGPEADASAPARPPEPAVKFQKGENVVVKLDNTNLIAGTKVISVLNKGDVFEVLEVAALGWPPRSTAPPAGSSAMLSNE
jgi:hypothetical protein